MWNTRRGLYTVPLISELRREKMYATVPHLWCTHTTIEIKTFRVPTAQQEFQLERGAFFFKQVNKTMFPAGARCAPVVRTNRVEWIKILKKMEFFNQNRIGKIFSYVDERTRKNSMRSHYFQRHIFLINSGIVFFFLDDFMRKYYLTIF